MKNVKDMTTVDIIVEVIYLERRGDGFGGLLKAPQMYRDRLRELKAELNIRERQRSEASREFAKKLFK